MEIDMLMLLYLRFADFPIGLIRSWSWEYSKDEAKAEEHLQSPLERNHTGDNREEKKNIYKELDRKFKIKVYSDYTDCNPEGGKSKGNISSCSNEVVFKSLKKRKLRENIIALYVT